MRNPKNNTPMSLLDVIKNGYFQQVRFLVEHGEDLDQRDSEKRTALMLCAFIEPEAWGVGICRLLIENGATLYFKDRYGLNAFHYAVIYERLDLVRVYLKAIDFNLNEGDKEGNTALHYAVRAGNVTITRLIAQMYVKYGLRFDKANNDGFTPLQEAHRLNKRKCGKILGNPDSLSDTSCIEAHLPLDLKSSDFDGDCVSVKSSKKSLSRPRSSVLSYRSSRSSIYTSSDYTFRPSPTINSYDMNRKQKRRDPTIAIPPNEKNNKQLIRCASASDIRNNPEYLFHISPVEETGQLIEGAPKRYIRAKSAFGRRSEVENDILPKTSWRTEFRKLYIHYQYQCTPSYRDTVVADTGCDNASLPPLDKPVTPATSEHAIDEMDFKGKKTRGKSASISRQNTEECLNAGKGRQASKQNARKISQNVGHGGKIESALESSSESINSAVTSKKPPDGKHSKPVKDSITGRTSRITNHKGVPAVNVEEA